VNLLGAADGSAADVAYVADVRERATRAAHYLSHGEWTDGWDSHGG
jgi:5-(carboxyamino)imidazole ribonucleotide synthase